MNDAKRPWPPDLLVGGALCLDFVNTVGDADKRREANLLADYGDLLEWAEMAGALTAGDAESLRVAAGRRPEAAATALRDALAVRERLHRLFADIAAGASPDTADLRAVDAMWERAARHLKLAWADGRAEQVWWNTDDNLDRPVGPVIRSAIELLTSPDLRRVKECGRCSWLFVDESRGGRRRWCRMQACGNRAKVQRHYARRHPRPQGA